ncbi:Cox23p SKDI_08G1620 [Saccharomyces kudriavzevii IFO 1802]|uniref:Cytochrome c oxidase-assembly factor COX23, mitochondrial n=2 Tax=Saccharomyces kudriavzevii (strain ATCC MYA-4449 / AS 2.2408 / CBS 8840 / NBRC 1802 / NCYC 2889) TaxID=226230 RepID=J5PVB9_SACK1|nr:uncharacterized protein SKDI_08G1620 [Saccharomyces kudriavzevii IFO 1802]EJT44048.1 COX23-like protein [Saccharomyces kudriavzevii IFO 1802]CAI4063865.1 hypothetical protein SKDI_08G1620 [Saccharomyces kudriavzevii IFO 1802]
MANDTSGATNAETDNGSSSINLEPSPPLAEPAPRGPITDRTKVNYVPKNNDPSSFQYYPDDPENPINKYKFALKADSQYYDPCEESSKLSFQCLERNDYDRSKCQEYFDAYRECKKQWLTARRKNRQQWE